MAFGPFRAVVRPLQTSIGTAWVVYKRQKHLTSLSDAQAYMDQKPVPVVVGPDGRTPYLLDHHHVLAALDLAGPDFAGVSLSVYVVVVVSLPSLSLHK